MKMLAAIFIILLLPASAADAQVDYFPLHTGDARLMSSGSLRIIGAEISINDTLYYEVRDALKFHCYYRRDDAGNIYQRGASGGELMIHRLDAKVGDEWYSRLSLSTAAVRHVTLESATETIGTYAGRFENCLKLVYRSASVENDGSITIRNINRIEWFAPGMGLVRTELNGRSNDYLYLAKVDGNVYSENAQSLHLISARPSNLTGIAIDSPVMMEFSRDIDVANAPELAILVTSDRRGLLPGSLSRDEYSSKKILFQPDEPFGYGELIQVTATVALPDYFGLGLAEPYTFHFMTEWQPLFAFGFRADSTAILTDLLESDFDWADIDRDGDYDLAIAGTVDGVEGPNMHGRVELFTNNGDGFDVQDTGMVPLNIFSARGRGAVRFMDFDGDGFEDIAYTGENAASADRTLFYRNDAGSFSKDIAYELDTRYTSMDCRDIGNGGPEELAVWEFGSNEDLAIIYFDNRVIRRKLLPDPALMNSGTVKLVDCGGNSAPDVVVAGASHFRIFINADGRFTEKQVVLDNELGYLDRVGIDAADVDGDGDIDLIVGATLLIADGDTYRTEAVTALSLDCFPRFNDIDGDGDMDLFIAGKGEDAAGRDCGFLRMFENREGKFSLSGEHRTDFERMGWTGQWIDLDHDGRLDYTAMGYNGFTIWYNEMEIPSLPTFVETGIPESVILSAAYPNPFNASTTIEYAIDKPGPVTIAVYTLGGQNVATLVDGVIPAGKHYVRWNGIDGNGVRCSSGMYLVRVMSGMSEKACKIQLLK